MPQGKGGGGRWGQPEHSLADVAAAAAAAIERPSNPFQQPIEPDWNGLIQRAQAEAGRRRPAENVAPQITSAQSLAAMKRGFGEEWRPEAAPPSAESRWSGAESRWSTARSYASPGKGYGNTWGQHQAAQSYSGMSQWQNPSPPSYGYGSKGKSMKGPPRKFHPGEHLKPEDFVGAWVDLYGNPVQVCSTDAWELRMMAVVTRPGRTDLQLSLRPLEGGGWLCGNCTLDTSLSAADKLHWVGPDGRVSEWMRARG